MNKLLHRIVRNNFSLCVFKIRWKKEFSPVYHVSFLRRTGLAKKNEQYLKVLADNTNTILAILSHQNFKFRRSYLHQLIRGLLIDSAIITHEGRYKGEATYDTFKAIIDSLSDKCLLGFIRPAMGSLLIGDPPSLKKLAYDFLINSRDFLSKGDKWTYTNLKPPIEQVDDFPKIDGVYIGEKKIGSSQKKKMQIGSIALHFTRIPDNAGKNWYKLDKIEGVCPYEKLPSKYLDSGPSVFLEKNTSVPDVFSGLRITYRLVTPIGSSLLKTNVRYLPVSLIPRLKYLVKAGQRLRDIKKEQREKAKKETCKESIVIQV